MTESQTNGMPNQQPLDQMACEILSQSDLVSRCLQTMPSAVGAALPSAERIGRLRSVHFVGCGDSHQVGLAALMAVSQWAGLPAQAHLAMEFSRYHAPLVGEDDLVIPVSNSGKVARTIEAAAVARARGAWVTAITGDMETPLAAEADGIIGTRAATSVGVTPGTHSFMASLMAAVSLAHHLAGVRGRGDHPTVTAASADLRRLPGLIEAAVNRCGDLPLTLSEPLASTEPCHVLGAGPLWGIALYAQMKFLESAAAVALPFELEEWAHSGFFLAGKRTPIVLLVCDGESVERAREIMRAVRAIGAPALVIGGAAGSSLWEGAALHIPLADICEPLSPALFAVPVQMMALALARRRTATPLGFDQAGRREINFEQIFGSSIRRDPPQWADQ